MTGLKSDARRRNFAPAKARAGAPGGVVQANWSRRRTLLFIVLSCALLWSLIGLGLWLIS
jgi:hypothetical protein